MFIKDRYPFECLFPATLAPTLMLIAFEGAARDLDRDWELTSHTDDDPNRGVNSLHRYGLAIDGQLIGEYSAALHEKWADGITSRLGYLFDVIFHDRHVHAEFDTKGKRRPRQGGGGLV